MKNLDAFDNIFDSTTDLPPAAPKGGPLALRAGDVIFIRVGGFLYGRVAAATGSWTSHVGVLHHCADGRWWVAESAIPRARLTPLDRFLARSERGLFAIRRLRGGLTPEQETRIVAAADRRLGAWYDLGFNYDSRRQFCSKFVHAVYAEALGFGPGRVERFSKLIAEQPSHALGFWRWWFAGRIPLRWRTVTPASQAEDPRFVTVAEGELGASPVGWSPAPEKEREALPAESLTEPVPLACAVTPFAVAAEATRPSCGEAPDGSAAAARRRENSGTPEAVWPRPAVPAVRPLVRGPEAVSLAWEERVSFALKNRAS